VRPDLPIARSDHNGTPRRWRPDTKLARADNGVRIITAYSEVALRNASDKFCKQKGCR